MSVVALGPAYRRLWSSTTLASVGDGIRMAAFPLLAAGLSARPALVAGVAAAGQVPWLLAGLPAGAMVDRVDRRRLIAVVDAVRTGLLAVLVAAIVYGHASIGLLYVVAFVGGLGETLRDSAAGTLVPALVPSDGWDRANGLLVTAEITGSGLAGPAVGGWLFGVAVVLPFAVSGGSLAVAVLLVLTLPNLFRPTSTNSGVAAGPVGTVRRALQAEIAEGVRFLVHHRVLRIATGLGVLLGLLDAAWFAILVLYVQQTVSADALSYGTLLAVDALGGVCGGVLAARIAKRVGSAALPLAVIATGAAQWLLAVTSTLPGIVAGLALGGFAFGVANVALVTLRQRTTPAGLLGRVTATYRTAATGAAALGALVGGIVATGYGVRAPMLVGAPILAAAGIVGIPMLNRAVRRAESD